MCANKMCSAMPRLLQHHFSQKAKLLQSWYAFKSVWWVRLNIVLEGFVIWLQTGSLRQSVRCLSVRRLLYFDLIYSSVKTLSHRGKWIQRHSLLVHMRWGDKTFPCWQVPKSHCPFICLPALCQFANQPSTCQLDLAKQILAGMWLLPVIYRGAGMGLSQKQQYFSWRLFQQHDDWTLLPHQVSTVLLRVESTFVLDGLWHFLQVGKVCQPPFL